jgi:hypothetical protein
MNKPNPLLLTTLLLGLARAHAADYSFSDTPGDHLDILLKGKALARYQYAHDKSTPERLHETYKPFLHVMNAAGTSPITKGAGGSFTHHRGIYIGWMKITVDGLTGSFDRWHMKGGNQVHKEFLTQEASDKAATLKTRILWEATEGTTLLDETRTFVVSQPTSNGYVQIDKTSVITAVTGDTKLDGDPEHAGLQFRPSMGIDTATTTYVFPGADTDAKKTRDLPWLAERAPIDGKRYTIAFLNHPENPKDTPFSAYRDYGRFGGFFRTSVKKGESATFKVRFIVAEGELAPESIAKEAEAFSGVKSASKDFTIRPADSAKKPDASKKPDAPKK